MINNFLNQQAEILKGLNAEILFALKDMVTSYIEETGEDCLEENEIKASAIVTKAIKNRMDEMIKAEKSLKNLCDEDEEEVEIEYFEEAKKIQKKYGETFNGRTLTQDQIECKNRVTKQIRDLRSFETAIDIINTTEDLMADGKFSLTTGEDLIFKNFLAICEVVNEIEKASWLSVEDLRIVNEESLSIKEYLAKLVEISKEYDFEVTTKDIEFLTQFGNLDDLYVVEYLSEDGNYYIVIEDGNENRLTDCYCPY